MLIFFVFVRQQSINLDAALEETKNYSTRALASVANQIHNCASNLLTLFDLQMNGINELEARANALSSQIRFTSERSARREIGKLTKPKLLPNHIPKVIKPLYPERNAAKKRRTNYYSGGGHSTDSNSTIGGSIDYSVLDDIGKAHRIYERKILKSSNILHGGMVNGYTGNILSNFASKNAGSSEVFLGGGYSWIPTVKSATLRPSKSSNLTKHAVTSGAESTDQEITKGRTPAPTVRPPTPPLTTATLSRFSSMSRNGPGSSAMYNSKDYRSLGVIVAPPQLPNNYQSKQSTQQGKIKQKIEPVQQQQNEQLQQTQIQQNSQFSQQTIQQQNKFLSNQDNLSSNLFLIESSRPSIDDQSWIPSSYLQKGMCIFVACC